MPPTITADTRILLEHLDWVRRLARSLVADPTLADDLTRGVVVLDEVHAAVETGILLETGGLSVLEGHRPIGFAVPGEILLLLHHFTGIVHEEPLVDPAVAVGVELLAPSSVARSELLLLLAAVGLVLLMGCAGATHVVLSRRLSRRREHLVRSALGAAPGRIMRQALVESFLLTLSSAAVGVHRGSPCCRWTLPHRSPRPGAGVWRRAAEQDRCRRL